MSVETNAEARPRVHPLMVELIIREIDGNAVIDAFTEKNLTVYMCIHVVCACVCACVCVRVCLCVGGRLPENSLD